MDNKNKVDGRDRGKVAGGEPYELAYLEKKLGVSRSQVENAIKAVGNSREAIEAYLKNGGRK
jgi:hypothetical protein